MNKFDKDEKNLIVVFSVVVVMCFLFSGFILKTLPEPKLTDSKEV